MLPDILKTLVTAMLPILEIRGAIPVGVAAGMNPWTAFAIGLVGNMLPVPFLILLTRKVIECMKKHHILDKLTTFVERKGHEKAKSVQAYSFWGLFHPRRHTSARYGSVDGGRSSPRFWICA